MRLWMLSTATMTAAAAMGLALGGYAISPQRSPLESMDDPYVQVDAPAPVAASADTGPVAIHCTGCGPTLADRRFAADMAGLDSDGMISGSDDPVVQDYLAEEPTPVVEVAQPSTAHQLHPRIIRFADGASAARPMPVQVVPTQEGADPADGETMLPVAATDPR
ncbi:MULTISPECIES: hypothetical protein [unclassified Sphingobium]|jgi:hypothetical protein|uniref:hypothetical protein n=1 Tax=unclassified Sphingobium TaxID=2611147 RepID=UPI0007F41CA9|nr:MULTISPECIES: hypothetical protein [unclassified Sphingobium]OAN52046.1 hypothetical protein A7Q26_10260 [Sphingobium sp. TCM1]WIW88228.1 hypothetical protein K3M67_14920 [Sphingobium sp. V4]